MAGGRVADQVGRVLGGRYRLVAPVGTGGSAHVYVADDTTLRRRVAVKVLQPALALDQAFLRRFRAEAQAAAALNHPNIMRVFDWGEDEEGPFLVLEFLGGGSLRDMLDSGRRLSIAQAVLVGLEAARALDYAHRRGLVHRDMKPANICFDEEGRTAVADFGLARALAEAAWTEPEGVLLGTARYAAPEAAQGKSVDSKADIYALGLVMLEAVTGDPPPAGDTTVATLMARASQPIVAPFGLGTLGPIIDAAGALDPDDRPDAADLAVMLQAAARELDSPAPLPVSTVLNLDARAPSAADPTEMGQGDATRIVSAVAAPLPRAAVPGHRSRRRVSIVIGALVAIAAVVAAALYVPTILKPEHTIPNVQNISFNEAQPQLSTLNFKIDRRDEYHETTAIGAVIRTEPKGGAELREDSTIHVYVSKGRAPRDVPEVEGDEFDIAKGKLLGAGFKVDAGLEFSETVEKDHVIRREPGTEKVAGGATIVLVVSDGPEPRKISDWAGKTFDEAKAALEAAGLKAKKADGYSDTIEVGKVINTNPAAGETAPRGSTVTVFVSVGPQTVTVPNVVGMNATQGMKVLRDAGLTIGQISGPRRKQQILFQDPGGNTKAARGTPVNLYIN
jgi:eukaryotic-like serine/threonine-protein kinase